MYAPLFGTAFQESNLVTTQGCTNPFADLAAQAGWTVNREWISEAPQFAVFNLTVSHR
jgi:hypothetical protein